jgi:hypothetical protein
MINLYHNQLLLLNYYYFFKLVKGLVFEEEIFIYLKNYLEFYLFEVYCSL